MKHFLNTAAGAAKFIGSSAKKHPIIGTGIATYLGAKAIGSSFKTSNSILESLYPGNMLPMAQGKTGIRATGMTPSPMQGVKFNFRRK